MENKTVSFNEALEKALLHAKAIQETKTVFINEALNAVLAQDIYVKKNMPSFDNSAMDGFAFKYEDLGKTLKIAKTIFAGDKPDASLKQNECYKIMTGAIVPKDVDTVVPIEKCFDITDKSVTLPNDIKKGANLRKQGEEAKIGEILIKKGTKLSYSHIALLAAQGITNVKIHLPLKIAVVSTGNEIKEPWEEASEDEIYNANAFGITAMLKNFGFDASYLGKIPDDYQKTLDFIANINSFNVIITTGGISHGEADFLYEAFINNSLKPIFHGIKIKPGHPTMMGVMKDKFVMGLPGNPLTTMLITHTLALPVLFKLQGALDIFHNYTLAKISQDINFKGKRTHLIIGNVINAKFVPINNAKVGSAMLTPLSKSSAIAYFDEDTKKVSKGEMVKVISLNQMSLTKEADNLNRF